MNGWLNHTRGGRWTEPPIEAGLAQVQAAGYSRVVYFPYGFLADNAESELEGRMALATVADLEARHLPCLNDSPALMEILAQQLQACVGSCDPSDGRVGASADSNGCARLCRPSEPGQGSCDVCAVPPTRSGATREPLVLSQ